MEFLFHNTACGQGEEKEQVLAEMLALLPDPDLIKSCKGSVNDRTTEIKRLGIKRAAAMSDLLLCTDPLPFQKWKCLL